MLFVRTLNLIGNIPAGRAAARVLVLDESLLRLGGGRGLLGDDSEALVLANNAQSLQKTTALVSHSLLVVGDPRICGALSRGGSIYLVVDETSVLAGVLVDQVQGVARELNTAILLALGEERVVVALTRRISLPYNHIQP